MTHDPLCDWWQDQCGDYCNDNLSYNDPCEHMWCTCALIAKVRADQDKKHINTNCMWGEAECIPDCPSCRRFDELYLQRSIGYGEGYNDALNQNKECTHQNSLDVWKNEIPYCSKCGQDTSYLYEMGN